MATAMSEISIENEDMFLDELKWFVYSKSEDAYICQVPDEGDGIGKICCAQVHMLMDGKRVKKPTSNMKRHIRKSHGTLYEKINKEQEKKKNAKKRLEKTLAVSSSEKRDSSVDGGQKKQSNLDSFFNKVTITISKSEFKKALNMLVLQNGASFNMFSGEGMKILTRDMARKFGVKVNRENVRDQILTLAEQKRSELRNELSGKLVFLKVDQASRHHQSSIIIRKPLAALDIHARHKAEDIQNALESVLDRFGIRKEQVLGISTDNGSNMVKMVKDFGKVDEIGNFPEERLGKAHDAYKEGNIEDQDIEDTLSEADLFDQEYEGYFDEISRNINTIHLQRCGAHTLQLAVTDGLKDSGIKAILAHTRKVAKACRTPIAMEFCKHTKPFKVIIRPKFTYFLFGPQFILVLTQPFNTTY